MICKHTDTTSILEGDFVFECKQCGAKRTRGGSWSVKPCNTCANKGKLLGLTQATYCENCIHGATYLQDLYMPKLTIEQMKANILSKAMITPLSDFDERAELMRQSRRLTAKLTTNWFLYGKRGITLKFNRYNPFMEP